MGGEKNNTKKDLTRRGLNIPKSTSGDTDIDRQYIQKKLMQEMDFDNSEDEPEETDSEVIKRILERDNILSSDEEYDQPSNVSNVKRIMCERCSRFYNVEYKRARVRIAHLSIDKTPGQHLDCEDSVLPILRECCIEYYERWV